MVNITHFESNCLPFIYSLVPYITIRYDALTVYIYYSTIIDSSYMLKAALIALSAKLSIFEIINYTDKFLASDLFAVTNGNFKFSLYKLMGGNENEMRIYVR